MGKNIVIQKGQEFGQWVVISETKRHPEYGGRMILCRCSCGYVKAVSLSNLIGRKSSHCNRKFHGADRNSRTCKIWRQMRYRCSNPNAADWPRYGARGIKCCSRWDDYENFYSDMGDAPDGQTLERDDVNGNYEPGNCRWATHQEQVDNRRNTVICYKDNVRVGTVSEAAKAWGIGRSQARRRCEGYSDNRTGKTYPAMPGYSMKKLYDEPV